jgi:hypothetical protein
MSVDAVDPSRCPLCGQDNKCGMVAGASTCWCFSANVARSALERVAPEAQGVACVCQACASGEDQPNAVSIKIDALLRGRR